jgi:choline kinase
LGGTPKALFELEGETLLGRCTDALHRLGFEDVMVVTGHGDDRVRDWWASATRPLRTQFVHNPRYADLNNFHTLEIACTEAARGTLLVLNSDIVFADRVVADAEAAGGDLTLAVEAGRVDDEALKVRLSDGHVAELGKHIAQADAHGEFIGVSLLSDRGRDRYAEAAQAARDGGEHNLYYEDVYSRICRAVDSRVSSVAAATWAEIDAPEDVPAARRVVQAHAAV